MSKVEIIEPKEKILLAESEQIINVVAYCRVSTDSRDQRNSLMAQEQFFDYYFNEHPNWVNRKIYSDEGISGTSLKKRDAFNEMVNFALSPSHPIDLIITKDVSRFSRNVVDFLGTLEKLCDNKVYVKFITQDISTEAENYRDVLREHIIRAEQESTATSNRVRFGQRVKMSQGVVFGTKDMFGYRITRDPIGKQHFEIIEDEANTVKKIFEWYNEGIGTHRIARKLEQMGITSKYKNGWSNTVILRILRQEKYVGDLLLGKTYTPDPLKHDKKTNKGESKMYRITDHHPEQAIISRELWDSVQRKLEENSQSDEIKKKHNNRYWLSGKVFCGICNERFIRLTKKQKNGNIYVAWDCIQHQYRGIKKKLITDTGMEYEVGCDSKQVNERVLKQAVLDIIGQIVLPQKDEILKQTNEYIIHSLKSKIKSKKTIDTNALNKELEGLKSERKKLLDIYLKGIVSEDVYVEKYKEIEARIFEISEELQKDNETTNVENEIIINIEKYSKRIEELFVSCFENEHIDDSEYQEELLERVTKKIIVHPDKILEIYLNVIPFPIFLKYSTTGRGENYSVNFTVMKK